MGLIGSLHCAGMCGPIAVALPYRTGMQSREETFFKIITYNFGRVITYSLMGLMFGLVGKSFFTMGVQKWVLITLAVLLILVALFSIDVESESLRIPAVRKFNMMIKNRLSLMMKNSTVLSFLYIGILNGFLPCGLVYMAIVAAIAIGSVYHSILYMALLGIGTMPLMIAFGLGGNLISARFRRILRKMYPVFMIAFAVLFLMRAFKIGYLSDDFNFWMGGNITPQKPPCCE